MQTCRNVKSKEVRRSNLKLQKTVQEAFGKYKNTIALCVIKKCLFCSPYRGFSCSPYRILCRKFRVFTLPRCSPYRDSSVQELVLSKNVHNVTLSDFENRLSLVKNFNLFIIVLCLNSSHKFI
jgi:hypothetical protein